MIRGDSLTTVAPLSSSLRLSSAQIASRSKSNLRAKFSRALRTSAMIGSRISIGFTNQFLWRANNGRLETGTAAYSLDSRPKSSVGDVRTVPGQQVVHSVNSGSSDMQGIYFCSRRQRQLRNNRLRKRKDFIGRRQPRNCLEDLRPSANRVQVALRGFLDDSL